MVRYFVSRLIERRLLNCVLHSVGWNGEVGR